MLLDLFSSSVCNFPKDASMASLRTSQRTKRQKILSCVWWEMSMAHHWCLTWQWLIHQGAFMPLNSLFFIYF